ncbi:hypothetical protein K7A41_06185 [Sphingobacterium sp. InxBP1]|uniref:homing endonuclease associated repeat-containing protein n=1 Tax=Sphingobacterium sp. InxBP1 TaxID=2870328 RepID=UPI0022439899|nr:hypothetical protein [Sphingobacterium sp. InxBP1]MCW8310804.1 hypothetical protein [Sphingobacterium sp. InxBP1]
MQEEIIKHAFSKVNEFYKKHQRTPVRREMEDVNTIARRYFGTWNQFITAAGLKPNSRSKAEITDELMDMVKDFYDANGRIPMRREFTPRMGTIVNYFGSWNKFIAAAGFDPNDRRITSKGRLKNSLVKFYLKHRRSPTIADCVKTKGLYNFRSYFTHFKVNTWADVLEYAGLTPYFRITTMTEAEAKEKVVKLIKKHRIKHYKDYMRLKPDDYPSTWYLKKKFGWNNLCYLAGTKVPVSGFSIQDHYLSLAKSLGRAPSTKELEAKMKISSSGMKWKTGMPLNQFLLTIGQQPAHKTPKRCKLSKKELAELYKTKSIAHGFENGMPRSKLLELTGYSREVYEKRFFSMNGLRLVCGFKLNTLGSKQYTEEQLRDILKRPQYVRQR